MTRPITVEGEALSLARLKLEAASGLLDCSVSEIEQNYDVSVVLLREDGRSDFHPAGARKLKLGHVLGVLGGPEQINRLVDINPTSPVKTFYIFPTQLLATLPLINHKRK